MKAVIYMIKFMVSGMLKTELSDTTNKYSGVFFKYFGFCLIYLIYCPQGLEFSYLIDHIPVIFLCIWLCYAYTIDVSFS